MNLTKPNAEAAASVQRGKNKAQTNTLNPSYNHKEKPSEPHIRGLFAPVCGNRNYGFSERLFFLSFDITVVDEPLRSLANFLSRQIVLHTYGFNGFYEGGFHIF